MDISPAEVVHHSAVPHDPVPLPGSIAAFQSALRESFSTEQPFDVPRPAQSSPAATSVSSFTSHTSSPAMPGLSPAYTSLPSASLASAMMDSMGIPARSRSGSAASPCRFMGSSSDVAFPTVTNNGNPTSTTGSGYCLPVNEYDVSPPAEEAPSPDLGTPPMMMVGNVLKKSVLYFFSSPKFFLRRHVASCKPQTKRAPIAVLAKLRMRASKSIRSKRPLHLYRTSLPPRG